jgi:dTDP-4-amino-4,6-dideoxygalactose transaminase
VGLYGLLRALQIGEGDEVLVQVPTHIVVANAIRYTGARPVYVDCRLEDYNIDVQQATERAGPHARALVLQHTFGVPADIDGALALAGERGLAVIEDCVHALGAALRGRPVGSFGRAAFFSTEETKTISTTMGGMVVTADDDLAARMRAFQRECPAPPPWLTARYVIKLIAYHLLTEPHVHRYSRATYESLGRRMPLPRPTSAPELDGRRPEAYEQRLANAQALLGIRQLERLEANVTHREAIARDYADRLGPAGFRLPTPAPETRPSWVRYPVWVSDRSAAERALAPHAVAGTWFTSVLEEATSPAAGGYQQGTCPRAEETARHLVNLPTHPRVTSADVETLTAALEGLAG